ncbi:hypothetical protein IKF30_02190 [Candidatus Saccharibacteria bacterium]|nr:hypothetical protein [Candidatus Saccharibacteria bacterium]
MYISIKDARDILEKKAYDWAIGEQKRMGCMAEPVSLEFESDFLTVDRDGCIISLFYDQKSNKAMLRRDWLDDMGIKYNILVNLDEIKKTAPLSVAHMLENGIKVYRYYDGPTGGVTRKINKEWR